jgi:hypothetical protein
VDNIVDFNERLADRMLMVFEGRNPSDASALSEVASKYRWRTSDTSRRASTRWRSASTRRPRCTCSP